MLLFIYSSYNEFKMNIFKQTKKSVERNVLISLLNKAQNEEIFSQKLIAKSIGIAVGIINLYIRRCVDKGLIKIKNVPNRRYIYYLTPKGFEEKTRLVAQYLTDSFSFFKKSKKDFELLFRKCKNKSKNIAIVGNGDLIELALIVAKADKIKINFIFSQGTNKKSILGTPVTNSLNQLSKVDTIIFAEYLKPQKLYDLLKKKFPKKNILYPSFLLFKKN